MKSGRPRKPIKARTSLATLVSKWTGRVAVPEATEAGYMVAQAETPVRILVPHDCKVEIVSVPEGTEIRIRYSSKTKPKSKREREVSCCTICDRPFSKCKCPESAAAREYLTKTHDARTRKET